MNDLITFAKNKEKHVDKETNVSYNIAIGETNVSGMCADQNCDQTDVKDWRRFLIGVLGIAKIS